MVTQSRRLRDTLAANVIQVNSQPIKTTDFKKQPIMMQEGSLFNLGGFP